MEGVRPAGVSALVKVFSSVSKFPDMMGLAAGGVMRHRERDRLAGNSFVAGATAASSGISLQTAKKTGG